MEAVFESLRAGATTLSPHKGTLGVFGAFDLANALSSNRTLTTLRIFMNGIGDAGASKLAEALKSNTTLTTLDLDGCNNIGEAATEALLPLAPKHKIGHLSMVRSELYPW